MPEEPIVITPENLKAIYHLAAAARAALVELDRRDGPARQPGDVRPGLRAALVELGVIGVPAPPEPPGPGHQQQKG